MNNIKKWFAVPVTIALLASFAGCQLDMLPSNTEVVGTVTTPAATTEVTETTPVMTPEETTPGATTTGEIFTPTETEPTKTTHAETAPVVTTPGATTPTKTTPVATTPSATGPDATKPESTTPAHTHSYQATNTVAANCTSQGYTEYTCSCGSTVKRDYTEKLGHNYTKGNTVAPTCTTDGYTTYYCTNKGCTASYREDKVPAIGHDMQLAENKAATTTEEGYEIWKCAHEGCDKTETKTLDKIPEVIDIAALEAYGRSYAEGQGYRVVIGLRDGYYPGLQARITTMDMGRMEVRENIDATTRQLEACGLKIFDTLEDGTIARTRFDIKIDDLGNGYYRIWVYYG